MILDVRQLTEIERKALESVLHRPLRDDDRLTIDFSQSPPATRELLTDVRTAEVVPDSWNVYRGLSDAEIEEVEASFQRLDLGRQSSE